MSNKYYDLRILEENKDQINKVGFITENGDFYGVHPINKIDENDTKEYPHLTEWALEYMKDNNRYHELKTDEKDKEAYETLKNKYNWIVYPTINEFDNTPEITELQFSKIIYLNKLNDFEIKWGNNEKRR